MDDPFMPRAPDAGKAPGAFSVFAGCRDNGGRAQQTARCYKGLRLRDVPRKVTVQLCVKENERMAAEGRYRRDLPPIIIRFSGM